MIDSLKNENKAVLAMNCAICDGSIPIYDLRCIPKVWMCDECRKRLFKVLYPERCKNDDT